MTGIHALPWEADQPVNLIKFSDGRGVICRHDGAPCPGCCTPRENWPEIWKKGFTLIEAEN